jgi:hypothetical protein
MSPNINFLVQKTMNNNNIITSFTNNNLNFLFDEISNIKLNINENKKN